MSLLLRRSNGYSKVDKEDPDEKFHRRAQFLIYKTLQQADVRRKESFLSIRLCKMKVKIGKRLRKLRKSMLLTISTTARFGTCKRVLSHIKSWKLHLLSRRQNIVSLPSLFVVSPIV